MSDPETAYSRDDRAEAEALERDAAETPAAPLKKGADHYDAETRTYTPDPTAPSEYRRAKYRR